MYRLFPGGKMCMAYIITITKDFLFTHFINLFIIEYTDDVEKSIKYNIYILII